ncbi:MAG: hypothetical protein J6U13_03610 [Salinivirgaceae bacterium]|nr:hypothetical protein [Salinivirgaceae bacterium]
MRRYIFLFLSFLVAASASSQSKYKDVYENIKHQSDNEAYQSLQQFSLTKNNSHCASLYKMGIILERRVAGYDPFLQETAAERAVYDMELFFGLAKFNFNEKVARQDGHFFDDVVRAPDSKPGKAPTFLEISEDIENHLNKATIYKNYFVANKDNLYKAVGKYNECISIFNDICQRNSKLKDLYFLVDEQLEKQLDVLQNNFDSTLFYLKKLQKSLAEYPMLNYKFNYKLNPIVVYRMHGLTQADFLAKEIQLWDFASWIKTFNEVRESEVGYLYKNVEELDNQHKIYMQQLENKIDSGVPANYKVSLYLLNKIQKYDNTSMANQLLTYQQSQINYAQQLVSYKIDTAFMSMGANYPLNDYFDNAIVKRNDTDSLLKVFEKNINPEGIKKYSCVFEKHYNGEKGLRDYVNQQRQQNDRLFDKTVDDFSATVLNFGRRNAANRNSIVYNGDTLFAQLVSPTAIWTNGYFVHNKEFTDRKELIVSGTYVTKRRERFGFVASIDTTHNIQWLKVLKNGDGDRTCLLASPINGEVAAVVTATAKNGTIRNFMVLFDGSGNVKQNVEVRVALLPKKLIVNDINDSYIVAFCGKSNQPFAVENGDLRIVGLDSKFKTLWNKSLNFNGYFVNILKNNDIYYVFGAFSKIKSLDNEDVNLNGSFGMFQYSFDANGNWLDGEHYEFKSSVYPLWVSKIDNTKTEAVMLIGNEPKSATPNTQSAYMQFSFSGDELYGTIK